MTLKEMLSECTPESVRTAIVEAAQRANAQYPQYKGHWEGPEWRLARMVEEVVGSLGQLHIDQCVIACPNTSVKQPNPMGELVDVYAQDGNIDMVVPLRAIEWLEPERVDTQEAERFAEQVLNCVDRLNGFLPQLSSSYDDPLVLLAALAEHVGGGIRVLMEENLCAPAQAEKVLQHIRDTAFDQNNPTVVRFTVPIRKRCEKPKRARRPPRRRR